ncbi:branched-chain amino acid ABC transporter ATP-binding protein/permease [Azospirillum rugosum]|uniref:Branched-chain amino acid transport system permease protein n=1 Tax=Azospirillum rugosum TaxID=416170 RepID=A0ABS4SJL7_9PROT|nr:branched-chain amino acid ABC transporter ATP-binding protein/permease [Azospirillum rugosum]MBP2292757.1 branched-chain amino acid transport system permease protein [Azospirillum rugosum]MDQ0527016.1 branched-chain amino acid transport system permease protein [Azospirillum rugosum]
MRIASLSPHARIFLVLVPLLALLPLVLPTYQVTLANNIGIFALATLGIVLLTGIGGMTSFGQAAFVGISAYSTAYLAIGTDLPAQLGWLGGSPWGGLLLGMVLTLAVAALLGALTLRLSGHYLPLGTIAWGLSLFYLFGNLEFLGGHTGLSGMPALRLFGISLDRAESLYYLIWALVLLAVVVTLNLLDSREGRAIRALRGGQRMSESMGVNTFRAKMVAFLVSAGFAALAGWLYAYTQRFVSPAPFSLQAGIDFMFMALIGGVGQVWGALIGATAVTFLKQWLQDWLPHILGRTGNFESIVFGLLIVVLMQRMPGGIAGWLARHLGHARKLAPSAQPAPTPVEPLPRRALPAKGEAILEVRGVTKRFGGLVANNDISFDVHAGEILAVIGPNGAGKSTLFNQLSCVDRPTSGEIRFRGRRIDGRTAREMAGAGLSRTFQHVKLLPTMSVLENAAIGAHLRGGKGVAAAALRLDRREEARLLDEARRQLGRVGLGQHLHAEAGSLALGQQRILEIARALCADPCLLLLDEPAAGLRHLEKQALAELLKRLRAEGMAIVLVEHDMDFVMGLVDRVFVMEFGEQIAEGVPETIQTNPAVLEAYLGGVE